MTRPGAPFGRMGGEESQHNSGCTEVRPADVLTGAGGTVAIAPDGRRLGVDLAVVDVNAGTP